ncbi:MAG TPA: hypothetical protein VN962_11735 [Polyangia bacterium]|nr:hypothetical protein [Polyangia bacterium]
MVVSAIGCDSSGGKPDAGAADAGAAAGSGGMAGGDLGGAAGNAGAGGAADGTGGAAGAGDTVASCMQPDCSGGGLPAGVSLNGIWIAPGGTVWTVGEHGYIGRHSAGSAPDQWCFCHDFDDTLNAVWGPGDDDVFAVGRNGRLLEYGSASGWFPFSVGADVSVALHDVSGLGDDLWIVGDQGFVVQLTGPMFNRTIQRLDVDTAYSLRAVFSPGSRYAFMVGNRRIQIAYQADGGVATIFQLAGSDWFPLLSFVEDAGVSVLLGLSGNSFANLFAVGQKFPSGSAESFGFVARSDGGSWRPADVPQDLTAGQLFTDVAVGPPGLPDGAYITPDLIFDGTTWTRSTDALAGLLTTVDTRGDEMWAAGQDGVIARWNGSGWTVSRPATPLPQAP